MKLKLLIPCFFASIYGFSQSVLPPYVVVSNPFYIESLSGQANFLYLGQYSADSAYLKIMNRTLKYKDNLLTGLQSPRPSQKINYQWRTNDTLQVVTIRFFDEAGLKILETAFSRKEYDGEVLYRRLPFLSLKVKIGNIELQKLLANENVKFINFEPPKVQEINFVERTNHRISQFAPNFPSSSYLTGKGITMGEWDGGDVGRHVDFDSRLTVVKNAGINSHATHVAGTMAGAGNLEPDARGMAPEAKIFSWDFNNDIILEMDTNKTKLGYVLTQNSYGYWTGLCADFAQYDGTSTDMDKMSIKYPDLLHVFAAGNSRGANCVSGGYKTILSGFQSAKNTISVAAVSSIDGDSYFSCAGPTQDGRFKPEISAVGVNVYSTQDNNTYAGGWSGTSMATPGASGSIALIYEKFKAKYGYIPKNYLGKNIMANTADDIGNIGPDYYFGFGRINGRVAANLIDSGFWNIDSVSNNGTYLDTIYIPRNLNELKVMLTWNDVEVNPSASPILVNDLDLSLVDSAGTNYSAWWCNPNLPSALAVRKRDSINNIEQVTIKNPPGGRVIIRVFGKKIPSGKQAFSVTYMKEEKGLTIVYPNGKETMESPSNAAKAQTIRWDSKGITGNYSLDFSRDNGNTWQSIATNIPNTQNYYTWQNLADTVSTSKALIRISNGTKIDVSDNVFNIAGLVSGITTLVCDSQVYLRWKKVPQTAFYRVYMLKNGKMLEMGTPTDTSFLITKLNNGKAAWFSISRRGTNGAESQRTVAVSATPNNLNFPPRVTLQPKDTFTCYNNLYYVKSKATGTGAIATKWEYSKNNGITWNNISNVNDSINLKLYTSDFDFTVRRTYTNLCLAPVYTRTAVIKLDSLLDVKMYNRDSVVCKNSVIRDSVYVKSKIPSIITWYNDSLTSTKMLQKGTSKIVTNVMSRSMSVWAEVANFCGVVKTKDLTKAPKLNGRNEYTLYPQPSVNIKDTLIACIGETINIAPVLSGGRPGFQKLIIKTEDSTFLKNSLSRKIVKNQWVTLYYFDNCYPDTTVKKVYIKMRDPLSVALNNDSTICYSNKATLKVSANGGNGNYVYTWKDMGPGLKIRQVTLSQTTLFTVTLTDNCTESPVSDSVLITVLPALDFTLKASKDTLCHGNNLTLTLTPSGGRTATRTTTWKDASITGNQPVLNVKKSSWYPVTLSDGCSPARTDSVFVFVWAPLSVKINKVDTLCNGKTVTLSAIGNGGLVTRHIDWKPISQTGLIVSYTPVISQDIIAVVSDGCTFPDMRDTLRVNAYDALQLVTVKDTATCYGNDLTLTVKSTGGKTGTQKYYWQNNRSKAIEVDSFVSGTYKYAVADACKDSIVKSVMVTVSPKLNISPSVIKKCSYDDLPASFTVNTNLPSNITWDKLPAGKSQVFKDAKSTSYIATLSDGCSDTSMVVVPVVISDFSANSFTIERVITKTAFVNFNQLAFKTYFNWRDGIQTTENGVTATHTYADYGQYTMCRILMDNIGCSDTICKTIDNFDPSGFKEYELKLFPNPVQDYLKFTFNKLAKFVSIEITDANGKSIYSENLAYPPFTEYEINLKGVAAGVYTVKLTSNGELFVQKFVKVE